MKSEPKIRFPEFDDSYSCSYLSDYLTVNTARNKDGAYSKEDVLSVSGEEGIVNQIQLLGRSYAGVSVLDYHIVNPDDIVYTKSPLKASPFGIIKCNKGQSGIVSTLYSVYTPKESVLPSYVEDYFALDSRLNRYLKPIVRIGAKHDMKVSNSAVLEGEVSFPSLSEQKKIADFLSAYDKKISLQKERVETLKEQKKGLLQKMFPKKGETVPELRFPGFTGDWEQRKLGELVNVCSGRDYKHLSEGNIPVYGTGGYMLSVNEALSYDEDAIGIGRKGTIDKPFILSAPFWTVDTLFYAIPREKVDLNFAFDIFQNIDWKKKDESTGVPSLSKTAINDIDVLAPKPDEQQTIGQYFANIDHLITLHQRKLETMQEIKKGLLQQMFV